MGFAEQMTPHGCRSTFRDWCGDVADVDREIAEMALAHRVGNTTEAAYRHRTAVQKRRVLMQRWADYIDGPPGDADNVVSIRA